LAGSEGIFQENADIRFHHENTYPQGTEPPPHPQCRQEKMGKDFIQVTCEGPFPPKDVPIPTEKKFFMRLVICGLPDQKVLASIEQQDRDPLKQFNNFLERAWINGDSSLWDLELCPDRRYVDYEFEGSKAQFRFPLQAGEMNLITILPRDYEGKESVYGPRNPNYQGNHNVTFATNRQMNQYLYNARVERVVLSFNSQDVSARSLLGSIPPGGSINKNFGSRDTGTHDLVGAGGEVPDNVYCQEVAEWDPSQVKLEKEIRELVNKLRAQGGACGAEGAFDPGKPLRMNPILRCAARNHSQDLFQRDFFSHVNPSGQNELARILEAGKGADSNQGDIRFTGTGENLAMGFSSVKEAIEKLLTSDDHCANLFNPNFTEIGVGYHPGGAKGPLLTVDFAKP